MQPLLHLMSLYSCEMECQGEKTENVLLWDEGGQGGNNRLYCSRMEYQRGINRLFALG